MVGQGEEVSFFIKELKSNNSFDEKSLIELNEIKSELDSKKFGLIWEEHEEAINVKMTYQFLFLLK